MTASAVISVLLACFRHLLDDGLGCLILLDAAVFSAASVMDVAASAVTSMM